MQEQSRGRRSSTSAGGGHRWFFSLQRKGKKNKLLSGSSRFSGSRSEWDLRKPPVNFLCILFVRSDLFNFMDSFRMNRFS